MNASETDESIRTVPKSSLFLIKADAPLTNAYLRNLSQHRKEQSLSCLPLVRHIVKKNFREEVVIIPLKNIGTFNLIYQIVCNNESFLLKIPLSACSSLENDAYHYHQINVLLKSVSVRTPKIYNFDHYTDIPYLLMEFISASSYLDLLSQEKNKNDLIEQVGEVVRNIHLIKTHHYGLLEKISSPILFPEGTHKNWYDYICTNLENHLNICLCENYLTREEYDQSLMLFNVSFNDSHIEPSLLHGDLSGQNLIKQNDEWIILDWEDALSGDPIFDIAMWSSFIINNTYLNPFLNGYYKRTSLPDDFEWKYTLYLYRILLAKTVLRFRFQYCQSDHINPRERLIPILFRLMNQAKIYGVI